MSIMTNVSQKLINDVLFYKISMPTSSSLEISVVGGAGVLDGQRWCYGGTSREVGV